MIKTLQNALKVKEIRSRLLFTLMILLVVRIGCAIPAPGVNTEFFASWFASQTGDAFNFFNVMTGGSFTSMSIFALNISPYITASIIIQLLTIAIPALEELQKDAESGRQKINDITRYSTVALAIIEGTAMTVGFGRQGLLLDYTWYNVAIVVITMTAGSVLLMWMGEKITEKGIGNGISMILLFNILSSLPSDIAGLFNTFVFGKSVLVGVLAAVIIIALIVAMVVFVVLLNGGERRIPVQYAAKMQGRRSYGGQSSNMPIKVNTAGVIPVIFASSIMSLPVMIASFFSVDYTTIGGKILAALSSANWCKPSDPLLSLGLLVYIALIFVFAYFYTSITFNPIEIANNLKKQGGFVPGIRPGKPTSEYLNNILNYIVFIGAAGLTIVAIIPIVLSGFLSISNLSFAGTSLIIIVGVILETMKQIESMMRQRNYSGFLTD
ncbi:MAG: preprotein translocase subunit SecY [Lachnospiraceae bacterium]|nr:preprotein translocase subunit SecY [Lachnospiraceae bacterium]